MFTLETLILFIVLTIAAAAVLLAQKRRGAGKPRLACTALFFLALFGAYVLKLGNTAPAVNTPIPLYKLFAINEYGYMGIFNDLIAYALPFAGAGLLLAPLSPSAAFSLLCSWAQVPLYF